MRPYRVIFAKEFFEVFRDTRTRFNVIVSPLLITPLILALVGSMTRTQVRESATERVSVAVVGLSAPAADSEEAALLLHPARSGIQLRFMSRPEAERAVRAKEVRAAIVLPPTGEADLQANRPLRAEILFDQGNENSQTAADRAEAFLEANGKSIVSSRLTRRALPPDLAVPVLCTLDPVPGGQGRGMLLLALFLPYTLALSAIIGGVYVANDSVAGEKERGTLETLLASPASRQEIVLGKFLAVAALALVNSLLSLVGLIWPFYVRLPAFAWMSESGVTLRPLAILAMLLVQVPLAILGAGLLLTLSTYARNQREAQSYLGPVMLAVTVSAMMAMFLKADAALPWALMPITNAALVLKQALEGATNPIFVVVACAASAAYAALAVGMAARSFQRESILLKA